MNKIIIKLILFGLMFFASQLNAQQTIYPTKTVDGIEYILYTVQQSEGLYAISKRFNVTQAEINTLNPEIQTGLKVGQKILIPINLTLNKETTNQIKTQPTEPVIIEQQYIKHKVLKRQTLFAISRMYDVDRDVIRDLNPQIVRNRLKTGMVLRIPNKNVKVITANTVADSVKTKVTEKNAETVEKSKYIIHIIKAKETLYSISNRYKVSIDEITKLNNITDGKLRIGYELKIPRQVIDIAESFKIFGDSAKKDSLSTDYVNYINLNEQIIPNKKPIKIAFLLPFMLDLKKKDPAVERFQDFYAGALIAIEKAKSRGISLEILTFDTEKSNESIEAVLNNEDLKKVDFIIGPAYSNQIPYISNFARENKIYTLIPFSSKINDIAINKYLFQFNPDIQVQANFIKETILNKYNEQDIVFINIKGVSILNSGNEFIYSLQSLLDKENRSYDVLNPDENNSIDISQIIDNNKKSLVFFNTDKLDQVKPYLELMDSMNVSNNITIYDQDNWINRNTKHLTTISISPFKTILQNEEYNYYNTNFTKFFNWNTSKQKPQFDLLGYDLTNYFVSMLYTYDGKFKADSLSNTLPLSNGIQTNLKFSKQNSDSGFKNHQLFLVEKKIQY